MSTGTERGADLPVPDASEEALVEYASAVHNDYPRDSDAAVRAIAAPVVAAELRRLADDPTLNWQTYRRDLRARADQLDG